MSRPTITDFNPKFHAEIAAQLGKPKSAVDPKKRLRQRTDKRSALEDRFGAYLKANAAGSAVYDQFPLRIGSGCNYYLDFLRVDDLILAYRCFGYEVKGSYARTAGIVKLKAAATRYPWIEFSLVSWINGQWVFERVRP